MHVLFTCKFFLKKILDIMPALVTCKNQEDPLKNEGVRVVT